MVVSLLFALGVAGPLPDEVAEHRTTLQTVGTAPIGPATTDRALAPTGYRCTLAGGGQWP